jgi:hypothetical protein
MYSEMQALNMNWHTVLSWYCIAVNPQKNLVLVYNGRRPVVINSYVQKILTFMYLT